MSIGNKIKQYRENKKIESEMKNISKEVKNIRATIVQYANVEDTYTKTIVNGYEKNNE